MPGELKDGKRILSIQEATELGVRALTRSGGMAPDAARAMRHSVVERARNSSFGMRAASQSDGPTSSVGCIVCTGASNLDFGERGLALRQCFGAVRGQQHGLAAQEIAGLG